MPAIQMTPAGERPKQNVAAATLEPNSAVERQLPSWSVQNSNSAWMPSCPSLMPHEATTLESLACMCTMTADLSQALRAIHQPRDWADVEAAKRRLAFEELLLLQLKLLLRREIDRTPRSEADLEGTRVTQLGMMEAGRDVLGFRLTAAQDRVLTEVCKVCAWPMPAIRSLCHVVTW